MGATRRWVGVSIGLLAACPTLAAEPAPDVLQVAGAADPASTVVLIRQGSSACAGTFVDGQGTVVTAYHCVADGGRARVQTRDGRVTSARVVSRLPRHDLAVLQAPQLAGEPWLALRTEAIAPGTVVRAWGHPLGSLAPEGFMAGTLRWSVSEGIVAAVGPRALQVTAPVNPGNSGGPLVDAEGRMVGVVSRKLRGDGLGFATRVEPLAALLEEPHRGSVVGGSFRAALAGSLWGADGGAASVGVMLEAAMRDRVVVGGSVSLAPQPNFDALRYGQATWSVGEGWVALRARAGHGYWTVRADVYGGAAVVQTVSRVGERASFRTAVEQRLAPIAGVRIALATVALDAGFVPITDEDGASAWATRTSLMLLWPGRLGVF